MYFVEFLDFCILHFHIHIFTICIQNFKPECFRWSISFPVSSLDRNYVVFWELFLISRCSNPEEVFQPTKFQIEPLVKIKSKPGSNLNIINHPKNIILLLSVKMLPMMPIYQPDAQIIHQSPALKDLKSCL